MVQVLNPLGTVVVVWQTEQSPVIGMCVALAVVTIVVTPGKLLPAAWQLAHVVATLAWNVGNQPAKEAAVKLWQAPQSVVAAVR